MEVVIRMSNLFVNIKIHCVFLIPDRANKRYTMEHKCSDPEAAREQHRHPRDAARRRRRRRRVRPAAARAPQTEHAACGSTWRCRWAVGYVT